MYSTIRNNFLVKNASDMTEEERQANISLGMEKAAYAADNMIDGAYQDRFYECYGINYKAFQLRECHKGTKQSSNI